MSTDKIPDKKTVIVPALPSGQEGINDYHEIDNSALKPLTPFWEKKVTKTGEGLELTTGYEPPKDAEDKDHFATSSIFRFNYARNPVFSSPWIG